jgi:hypothetical protein
MQGCTTSCVLPSVYAANAKTGGASSLTAYFFSNSSRVQSQGDFRLFCSVGWICKPARTKFCIVMC